MNKNVRTRREFLAMTTAGVGVALTSGATSCREPEEAPSQGAREVGVALVGVGSLTEYQLLPALMETQHCRPAGLVTSRPERVLELAQRFGIPDDSVYTYDDMARMEENPDIQMVHVVTPNARHLEHTLSAAQAGKHVLCEKPMATSVAEGQEMIDGCAAAGVKLAIGYRLRFEGHHQECIRLAREKVFGDLKVIEASFGFRLDDPNQWRLQRNLAGGGALIDAGIYALQACRYLTGEEPIEVVAFQAQTDLSRFSEVEESLTWQMRFPGGCLATCSTTYNAQNMDRFRAYGEHGWFGLAPAFQYSRLEGRRIDGQPLAFPHQNHFAAELDDFARCILDGTESRVGGEEGLLDMIAIEAIYQSVGTGQPVALAER